MSHDEWMHENDFEKVAENVTLCMTLQIRCIQKKNKNKFFFKLRCI